ncbi:MAG: prolipoprotein diacylglyceryl transferase [Flavobacteriales bacterium]|nr:prolipoprotein diacylglyceryl transferase [Flavobacteriales bacterium]
MITLTIVWDPPLGFDFGFYTLRLYSIMWFCAFFFGLMVMKKIAKKDGMSEDDLISLLFYVFIGTLIGARLGHCIFYEWSYFKDHLLEMILPFQFSPTFRFTGYSGLASHGAAIGIVISMILLSKKIKKPFLWIMDRMVIGVALGGAFIRIGNFFNSEIVGKPTEGSFGVIFKALGETFPRHPAQIYEALGYFILFFILWQLYKKGWAKNQGLIFGTFLIALFTIRILIEFVKENQEAFENDMVINMGQILSIPFILAGIALIIFSKLRKSTK